MFQVIEDEKDQEDFDEEVEESKDLVKINTIPDTLEKALKEYLSMESLNNLCKICNNMPDTLRFKMYQDHSSGKFTIEQLAEKYTELLKQSGIDIQLNSSNVHTHLIKHIRRISNEDLTNEFMKDLKMDLKINDEECQGKTIFDLVKNGETDEIKPISKGILMSKVRRLKQLYIDAAKYQKETQTESLKIHRELTTLENDIYKVAASTIKDFFLDSTGVYDKTLFVIQDLATKIFMSLQQKEIDYNGDLPKLEALTEIKKLLANLFDEYEREAETLGFTSLMDKVKKEKKNG